MPCTHAAREVFRKGGVRFGPGKAANAGGVACSGFEMHQNASHAAWTKQDTLGKLDDLMRDIHARVLSHAPKANGVPDYAAGADRAGFTKIADAMLAAGV
jgi:glutamate dehydrogenase (NADP+)